MLWPAFWGLLMLGFIVATIVVALREKKAEAKARAAMAPQPLGEDPALGAMPGDDMGDDFGGDMNQDDPFGSPDAGDDIFSEVEQN